MHYSKQSILFLLIIILVTIRYTICSHDKGIGETNTCLTQVCSYDEPASRYVRFPFLIKNESLPNTCGYPGFDLFCNQADKLLVDLPNSGVFSVKAIDYGNQELWLNDPNNCLAKRLLSLNLSSSRSSPFVPIREQVYWLYNCSNDYLKSLAYVNPIECLSGASYGVVATSSQSQIIGNSNFSSQCDELGPVRVPVGSKSEKKMYSSELSSDIMLTWVKPDCGECFQKGGQCGFKSSSSMEIGCFDVPHHGLARQAIVAIALAFAAPLALLFACLIYFIVKAICYRARRTRTAASIALAPAISAIHNQTVGNGLDPSVIESYPKVVLGESRRLPKPDDKSCPICLGEYQPKDILRTLPDCKHCFHAECIDEWLHLNASCPVCRNSPSPMMESTERA